jgi:hypothetical protein
MSGPRRDFFLEEPEITMYRTRRQFRDLKPLALELLRGDEEFINDIGVELFVQIVQAVRSKPKAMEVLIGELRGEWWRVRNARADGGAPGRSSVLRSAGKILDIMRVLRWAQVEDADVIQLTQCLSHGCTCDGCDLVDGKRLCKRFEVGVGLGGTGASSAP